MGYRDVTASESVEAASWIAPRLHPFGQDVGSVVPSAFAAYAGIDCESHGGRLTAGAADVLARLLEAHTSTPKLCWLCLWEGYGYLNQGASTWLTAAEAPKRKPPSRFGIYIRRRSAPQDGRARVKLPHRDYLLYQGSVAEATGWDDGPNLWWPDDRAWCVASEIDLMTIYVGGTNELIDAIADRVEIGAVRVSPDDPLRR